MFSFIKLQITEEISSTDTSARAERPVANEDNEELEAAPKKLIVSLLEEDDEEGNDDAEKFLGPLDRIINEINESISFSGGC